MHAPHHVAREWADRYAGQFDDGWDACRARVLARQKELGVVPVTRSGPATIRTCRTGTRFRRRRAGWRPPWPSNITSLSASLSFVERGSPAWLEDGW